MNITYMFVNKPNKAKHAAYSALKGAYLVKLQNYCTATIVDIKPGTSPSVVAARDDETQMVIRQLIPSDYLILLDERGKELDTVEYSKLLDDNMNNSIKNTVIVVGGAYGVGQELFERANKCIKLSAFVFPHQLAQLVILEQTYRAFTVLNNVPYHHE
jgi:23S rRNA (pseudouridine1915-N3)-methyltransferase